MESLTLLTDLYQLTMLGGYHRAKMLEQRSCFDLYFRRLPFGGGFAMAAGLSPALEYLRNLRFEDEQIQYLRSLNLFSEDFLDWLRGFRFRGDVWAIPEGEIVFPNEPLLRIEAALGEAQLVESALLNMVNFQTLVATKAARVCQAAGDGVVLEFGLRRAQGINGAMAATRASYAGGCHATSNTLAGHLYGVPVKGTHAHSWIMSFDSELEAFEAYAKAYPDSCTLLVDTYDTLDSGVPNAIRIGRQLAESGHRLAGIRLDSGDLAHLSIEARRMLDDAGFTDAKIVASNDLDEYEIARLKSVGAQIDIWGVGTNLATCKDEPALGGVYKLAAAGTPYEPKIKVSANPIKTTCPGLKQVYRFFDADGKMVGDQIADSQRDHPTPESTHELYPVDGSPPVSVSGATAKPLLEKVMEGGKMVKPEPSLDEVRAFGRDNLKTLPEACKALAEAAVYPVGLSFSLHKLRSEMASAAVSL